MASHSVGRAGVIVPPSLPTIKETTLSWLGSDLDGSLFSTNGKSACENSAVPLNKIQRYIDFDEQCLSLKSGEGSDFSGIQPLPIGSDDTPPTAPNEFNRVVQMNFAELSGSHNRPKPNLDTDEGLEEYELKDSKLSPNTLAAADGGGNARNITSDDFKALVGMLDQQTLNTDLGNLVGSGDSAMIEKLQLIRLWQLMQQEDLKRKQEAELALLNAKSMQMQKNKLGYLDSQREFKDDSETQENEFYFETGLEKTSISRSASEDYDDQDCAISPSGGADQEKNELNHDEQPIDAISIKPFEQLLEEELKKDEAKLQREKDNENKGPVKRPFLRKGQGLARFKGPPVRKPPRPRQTNASKKGKKDIVMEKPLEKQASQRCFMNSKKEVEHEKPPQKKLNQVKRMPIQKLQLKPQMSTTPKVLRKDDTPAKSDHTDHDLEEFEMLERYAEDDASFFSEPSLIVSLLQHERETHGGAMKEEGQMSLRERVRERRRLREEAKRKVEEAQKATLRENESRDIEAHEMVASSSGATQMEDGCGQELETALSPQAPTPFFRSPDNQKVKVIQRKTASLVKREKLVRPVAQPANCEGFSTIKPPCNKAPSTSVFTPLHSSPSSAFSPHLHSVMNPEEIAQGNTDALCTNQKPQEVANEFEDDQTWGDIDVSVLNMSNSSDHADKKQIRASHDPKTDLHYKCSDYMEPESEDIENPVRDTDLERLPAEPGNRLSLSPPPPPTVLMQKLFPGLKIPKSSSKQESQERMEEKEEDLADKEKKSAETGIEDSQASILKQKLEELEKEIAKFKKENAALDDLRSKHEKGLQHLSEEIEEFRKQKEEELGRLEEFKRTETKKLKKEKKLFEDHVLAMRMQPRKEEREEIQRLQEELDSLKTENKAKEQRWNSANSRLRDQVDKLRKENESLNERIKEMEEQRVKEWNAKKTSRPRGVSKWQAVSEIVESAVVDVEKESHHTRGKSTDSKSSVGSSKRAESGRRSFDEVSQQKVSAKMLKSKEVVDLDSDSVSSVVPSPLPIGHGASEMLHKDGKVERTLADGSKLVEFPNGTQKEISSDGRTVKVKFGNGDVKQMFSDGSIVYFYKENGTTHTTHNDGLQVFEFSNKQIEHHFPDGTKQITFPDQTIKYLHTDGTEQTVFPDGTEMHVGANKDKTIVFANGQREIHTESFKRREYPDGTSKTVFEDGRQETRYASGRLRVKDAHGNVIVDRMTNVMS